MTDLDLLDFEPDNPALITPDMGETEAAREGIEPHMLGGPLTSASISGLPAKRRAAAKRRAVEAATIALAKRDRVHYTMGGNRWDGIAHHRYASRNDFPRYADCSSFATWCLYQALRPGILHDDSPGDVVNGAHWKAGYTGTMLKHGKEVVHRQNVDPADCVIYGRPGSTGAHVAIVAENGRRGLLVISHGSEGGPYLLPYNYRSDIMQIRRYI